MCLDFNNGGSNWLFVLLLCYITLAAVRFIIISLSDENLMLFGRGLRIPVVVQKSQTVFFFIIMGDRVVSSSQFYAMILGDILALIYTFLLLFLFANYCLGKKKVNNNGGSVIRKALDSVAERLKDYSNDHDHLDFDILNVIPGPKRSSLKTSPSSSSMDCPSGGSRRGSKRVSFDLTDGGVLAVLPPPKRSQSDAGLCVESSNYRPTFVIGGQQRSSSFSCVTKQLSAISEKSDPDPESPRNWPPKITIDSKALIKSVGDDQLLQGPVKDLGPLQQTLETLEPSFFDVHSINSETSDNVFV